MNVWFDVALICVVFDYVCLIDVVVYCVVLYCVLFPHVFVRGFDVCVCVLFCLHDFNVSVVCY